jgi:transposase
MDAVSLPNNLDALMAIIADKDSYISQLEEQVRLLKSLHYQFKSEKAKLRNRHGQLSLFNEVELAVIELEKQAEESSAAEELEKVDAHVRRKKGRRPLSPDLPRVDRIHDIADDAKICPCGCALKKIGEEVSEKLDVIPQKIQVIRHIRPKYACPTCEGVEDDGPTVKIAPMPPQIITQGIVTAGLLAYICVNKFVDGLPLYRQEQIFARIGAVISRATMSGWMLLAAAACKMLMDMMIEELRYGDILNMDETTVQVLREPERENTAKSFMWVARGGPPGSPIVTFHYDPSRGGKVAEHILGDFKGYLQTDGYAGYNAVGARPDIIHVGCMFHVRSKFMDVIKAGAKNKNGTAVTIINLIGKIYKIEKQARVDKLNPDQIKALRQEHTRPIMDKIKAILDERVLTTPPKSLLGKAITYALGQWSRVEVFLKDGRLRPDNNLAENAIRPFAVGRKNWLFAGSPAGAHASATIYSLIETAKANGLNPYLYLLHVFTSLPQAKTNTEIRQLLPQNLTPQKLEELTGGNSASS